MFINFLGLEYSTPLRCEMQQPYFSDLIGLG